MADHLIGGGNQVFSRRQLLRWGMAGVGITGAVATAHTWLSARQVSLSPAPLITETPPGTPNPMLILRDFDWGILKREKGQVLREFRIQAQNTQVQLNSAVSFMTWNYNGRVPGPTLRVREGERVRVIFENQSGHAHTMHFHGIHPAETDGVVPVRHGKTVIYEFDAEPFGVHLYHCHVAPVTRHITKGLYGLFIVDPPQGRVQADELVLVMAGYDTNGDNRNELYAFNGLPDYYKHHPIRIYQNQRIRLYLLNMIEFDPALTFHIHANFFQVYPTGMTLKPSLETDVITLGTAERHILEFSYPYPGHYMFHPHQDDIAEHGCMGVFEVISPTVSS